MQKAEDKLLANRTFYSFLTGVPKSLGYSTRFLMQSKVKLSMILAEDNMQERRRMGIQQSKAAKLFALNSYWQIFCWKGETATIKEPGLDLKEKGRVRLQDQNLFRTSFPYFKACSFIWRKTFQ